MITNQLKNYGLNVYVFMMCKRGVTCEFVCTKNVNQHIIIVAFTHHLYLHMSNHRYD